MLIIGCDYHPSVQQIALVDTETGECQARRLAHRAEAERFYRELRQPGVSVRVGIEATGHSRWFERLLAELGFEVWIGDPARIRAKQVRKQKNDRKDAAHLRYRNRSEQPHRITYDKAMLQQLSQSSGGGGAVVISTESGSSARISASGYIILSACKFLSFALASLNVNVAVKVDGAAVMKRQVLMFFIAASASSA